MFRLCFLIRCLLMLFAVRNAMAASQQYSSLRRRAGEELVNVMMKPEQMTQPAAIVAPKKQDISGHGAFVAEQRRLCSSISQAVESSVTVVYYATTMDDLEGDLMTDLAAHFMEAYNERVEEFCDPFFRRITQATVDPQSAVVSPTASTLRFRIDLQAMCEDCVTKYGGPLFGARNKKTSKTGKQTGSGGEDDFAAAFQDNPSCVCRSSDPEYRGPTALEVQDQMNRALSLETATVLGGEDFAEQRAIVSGEQDSSVLSILEVEDAMMIASSSSCTEQDSENRFTTAVVVEMDSVAAVLETDKDETLFTDTFQYTFNELNFLACDVPALRMVETVEIIDVALPNDLILLNVTGTCRACQSDSPLFTKANPDFPVAAAISNSDGGIRRALATSTRPYSFQEEHHIDNDFSRQHRGAQDAFTGGDDNNNASSSCNQEFYCPINIPRLLRSPTEEEFQEAYQENLEQFMEASETTTHTSGGIVPKLDDLLEVQVLACSANVVQFRAYVWIEMEGSVELMSGNEMSVLEAAFVDTYNEMNTLYCDISVFRRALNATVLPRKKPLHSTPSALEDFQNIVQLEIITEGRNCPEDTALFHNVKEVEDTENIDGHRQLMALQKRSQSAKFWRRVLQSEGSESAQSACFCQKNNYGRKRSPTSMEYQQAFTAVVANLERSGQLSSQLGAVVSLDEQQNYGCDSEEYITPFQSTIWIEFDRSYTSALDDTSRSLLEERVVTLYNDLSYQACDIQYFRTVLNATVEEAQIGEVRHGRHHTLLRRHRRMESLPGYINYGNLAKITLHGECHNNCVGVDYEDPPLFHYVTDMLSRGGGLTIVDQTFEFQDSGHTRRRATVDSGASGTCFCPMPLDLVAANQSAAGASLHLSPLRAPTSEEFQHGLEDILVHDLKNGNGPSMKRLLEVDEFDFASSLDVAEELLQIETVVFIQVQGNFSALSDEDLETWNGSFEAAYNNLNFATCDYPLFRQVIDVSAEDISDSQDTNSRRRLQQEQILASIILEPYSSTKNESSTSLIRMVIRTECKACLSNSTLFASRVAGISDSLPSTFRVPELDELDNERLLLGSPSTSYCPADRPTIPNPPTEEQFRFALNSTVQALQNENEMFLGLGVLEEVVELEEFDCDNHLAIFETIVYLQLDRDSDVDTEEAIDEVLERFATVYNWLNFALCDAPSYRRVQELHAVEVIPSTSNSTFTQIKMEVVGNCRNCLYNSTLFSTEDNFLVDLTWEQMPQFVDIEFYEDQNTSTCFCPRNIPHMWDAPTMEQFLGIFNEDIAVQQESRLMFQNVTGVRDIREVQSISCTEKKTDFRSAVLVDLRGNLEALSNSEKSAMEESFKETYNSLAFSTCDEYFREVVDVRLIAGRTVSASTRLDSRLLEEESIVSEPIDTNFTVDPFGNETLGQNLTTVLPSLYLVVGTCRSCPVTESGTFDLFDDGFRRRMLTRLSPIFPVGRGLQTSVEECICPAGLDPGDEPPPTEEEFLLVYSENIEELVEEGIIQNIEEVAEVAEDESICEEKLDLVDDVLFATFSGNINAVEEEAIINTFINAYNSIREDACSPVVVDLSTSVLRRRTSEVRITSDITSAELFTVQSSKKSDSLLGEIGTRQSDALVATFLASWNEVLAEYDVTALDIRLSSDPTAAPSTSPSTGPPSLPTASPRPSSQPSDQPSMIPSWEPSAEPTAVPSSSPSSKPSRGPTVLPSIEPSVEPSTFPTVIPSIFPTVAPTVTSSSSPSLSTVPSVGPSDLPSTSPTTMPSSQPSNSPSQRPSVSAIPSSLPSSTPSSIPSYEPSESPLPSSLPSGYPSSFPSLQPSASSFPSGEPSHIPSDLPSTVPSASALPSGEPSHIPSDLPSTVPSASALPSEGPSYAPSDLPSTVPSVSAFPSEEPSDVPSDVPSTVPSVSILPTEEPSDIPSALPSSVPSVSALPSEEPSYAPSELPSTVPSVSSYAPSDLPSTVPSVSVFPSEAPSNTPSDLPSTVPSVSVFPSEAPSYTPSDHPSAVPSVSTVPSELPSRAPSDLPSTVPSVSIFPSEEPSVAPSDRPSTSPSVSAFPSEEPSHLPSNSPSGGPSVSRMPTSFPTVRPSSDPSQTPSLSGSPSQLPTAEPSLVPSGKPSESILPSTIPTRSPSTLPSEGPTNSVAPSELPTSGLSSLPSDQPSLSIAPSVRPSKVPSVYPSLMPSLSAIPSANPTDGPTLSPSGIPSHSTSPSKLPSSSPTSLPSEQPSQEPSESPSTRPSLTPSENPSISVGPSEQPSESVIPSGIPTATPSRTPSNQPSISLIPSETPTTTPTSHPSDKPSVSSLPSGTPSIDPTTTPSRSPSTAPSLAPSSSPSKQPSNSPSTSAIPSSNPTDPFPCIPGAQRNTVLDEYLANGGGSSAVATYGPIESWCFSNLVTMLEMFSEFRNPAVTSFNEDISNWDVSTVINMRLTFEGASSFNVDLSGWDVSSVTTMFGTFVGATSFNGDVSTWNVSSVKTMNSMFGVTSAFNGDLSAWDVSSVTNMNDMFREAIVFNGDISGWNVANLKQMTYMFREAFVFNGDLSAWDMSNARNMDSMFEDAVLFNSDLSGWDVSLVTDFNSMFKEAHAFNGNVGSWNVALATTMSEMFRWARSFNSDLSLWDTSSVLEMWEMFQGATVFNSDLSLWDVSKVTDINSMFQQTVAFNGDISTWVVSSVENAFEVFDNAEGFNGDLSLWDVSSVTDMNGMFQGAVLFNGDLSSWDLSSVTAINSMFQDAISFNSDISSWDVSQVVLSYDLFQNATLFNGDLSLWDTSRHADMSQMFENAVSFNRDISSWNVGSAASTFRMFWDASSFNQDLCAWGTDASSAFLNTTEMFAGTSCEYPGEPNLVATPVNPLCFNCVASTVPSVQPSESPSTKPSVQPSSTPS